MIYYLLIILDKPDRLEENFVKLQANEIKEAKTLACEYLKNYSYYHVKEVTLLECTKVIKQIPIWEDELKKD